MNNFPKRPASHSNGDRAVTLFRELCPSEWIVHEIFHDYGLDLRIELVKNGLVNGQEFYVQIKSIKLSSNKIIHIPIRQATINYWLAKLRPIAVVGVDIEKRQFIFEWLENAYVDYPNFSETDNIIQLQVPSDNISKRFERNAIEYIDDFFLKLSSDLANVFENTQLSRILFHASELHRLTAYTTVYLLEPETEPDKIIEHIHRFMLAFSIHDQFLKICLTYIKQKNLNGLTY